jgi:hypothetical protein
MPVEAEKRLRDASEGGEASERWQLEVRQTEGCKEHSIPVSIDLVSATTHQLSEDKVSVSFFSLSSRHWRISVHVPEFLLVIWNR